VDPTQAQDQSKCSFLNNDEKKRTDRFRLRLALLTVLGVEQILFPASSSSGVETVGQTVWNQRSDFINSVIGTHQSFPILQMSSRPDKASISFFSFGGCKDKGETSRDLALVCKQTPTNLLLSVQRSMAADRLLRPGLEFQTALHVIN
jgi:hypothetical protein